MTPSSSERRKRFERAPVAAHSLTPLKVYALRLLAESRFLATPQVAGLMGVSDHAVRSHLRDLYDLGLTDVVAVPGIAIGSKALIAAKIHYPTKAGLSELERLGFLPEDTRKAVGYSPQQFAFLGHELAVRDMLVWLTQSERQYEGNSVKRWDCSGSLQAGQIRPDAVFQYAFSETRVVAGILEADMGTQRGTAGDRFDRWSQKAESYAELFASEEGLRNLTGSPRARLVVTVPDAARAEWVLKRLSASPMAKAVWVGVRDEIARTTVCDSVWMRPDGKRQAFAPTEKGVQI